MPRSPGACGTTELSQAGNNSVAAFPSRLRKNRNFLFLWAAYGISAFGDHLSELGLMVLMAVEKGQEQTRITAAMTFVFFMPFFVLGPLAGVVADRVPRKYIMIAADIIRAGIVASIPLLPVVAGLVDGQALPLYLGLLPLLLVGTFAAFFSPARLSILPALVPDEQLVRANSVINGMGTICAMISFLVGGWLAEHYLYWTFRIDGLTFLVSALFVFMIVRPRGGRGKAVAAAATTRGVLQNLRLGLAYVREHRRVVHLIILTTVFWMAAAAWNSVTTPLVFTHYGLKDYATLGLFRGTLAGGMVLGAILLTMLGEALRSEIAVTWSYLIGGLALVGLAWNDSIVVGAILAILLGMCGSGVIISVSTLTQRIVPDYARGRVFGLSDWASMGGLMIVTGLLGLVPFPEGLLDAAVPYILLGMAAGMLGTWLGVAIYRQRGAPFGPVMNFWKNFVALYCHWWCRLKRIGPCTIPRTGPVIIAANHTSPIDPLLLLTASPYRVFAFMIAEEYYRLPVFNRLIRMIDCIPTTRSGTDTAAIKGALRHLNAGGALGIFPQGRIELAGETLGAKEGIAMLALRSGATVVPAHISGVRYNDNVPATFFRRHHARVRYGQPIDLSPYADRSKDRDAWREVADLILARIHALAPVEEAPKGGFAAEKHPST